MNFTQRALPALTSTGARWLATIFILLMMTACATERPVYHGAEYYKNLEIPPDLTAPDTREELKVPKPTEEALQRFRDNNKLETVITPKFDGVRMVSYAGNSWIEVDNNADVVWPKLLEFWEGEGIDLAQVRPLLGFMETDWTVRLSDEKGFFSSMFQKSEPDTKDKFRVRVERFDHDQKTRLHVAHSSIERRISSESADEYIWITLPSDLEAEREIISRMGLFAGLTREQSIALLKNYRPYSSLIKVDSSNATMLKMKGSMDFVWRRSVRALDRMRMQEIDEQKANNTINFSAVKLSSEELKIEEDDELAKSSWMTQLFSSSSDDDNAVDDATRKFRLEFTDLGGFVQIQVKDAQNTQNTDEDGDVSGTARVEQLRNILLEHLE